MKTGKVKQILQIIPAPRGLYAWLIEESARTKRINPDIPEKELIKQVLELVPLTCFALIDSPTVDINPIQGVGIRNGQLILVEQDAFFLGYYPMGEDVVAAARRYLAGKGLPS